MPSACLLKAMTPSVIQVHHLPVYALTERKCELPVGHVNNSEIRPTGAPWSFFLSLVPVWYSVCPLTCDTFGKLALRQSSALTSELGVVTHRYWVQGEQQPVIWPVEFSCVSTSSAVNTTGTFSVGVKFIANFFGCARLCVAPMPHHLMGNAFPVA